MRACEQNWKNISHYTVIEIPQMVVIRATIERSHKMDVSCTMLMYVIFGR